MPWIESTYKPEYCEVAVDVLSQGKSLAAVCVACGCCRMTLYNWRDSHPEFAAALNFGLQQAQAKWEERGERGIDGDVKNFAGSPWIFTMKNRFREDYGEERSEKSLSESVIEKLIEHLDK